MIVLYRRLRRSIQNWFGPTEPRTLPAALARAQALIVLATEAGRPIEDEIAVPILAAASEYRRRDLPPERESAFYLAYARLAAATADLNQWKSLQPELPFARTVDDAEHLLTYASEKGSEVPAALLADILAARAAIIADTVTAEVRARFYTAYAALSQLFGGVSAETIRNCTSEQTYWRLRRDRIIALVLTLIVACISVTTFVADSMSKQIAADIASSNEMAARLRAGLTPAALDDRYALGDPCLLQTVAPPETHRALTVDDVTRIQLFAATMRDLYGRAIKLNGFLSWIVFRQLECDPYNKCSDPAHDKDVPNETVLTGYLQVNPAIANYPAESLCKIRVYQRIRDFSGNVNANYGVMIGAFVAYALPILYAVLGAYAYRLRLFADQIQKRTYRPSFADSARMITAVIAGAIAGLFNPAQGLALSPLATAFLVGYGVELFFRFLDNLINAFARSDAPAKTG